MEQMNTFTRLFEDKTYYTSFAEEVEDSTKD